MRLIAIAIILLLPTRMCWAVDAADEPLRVASKTFTESYVLAEIVAQLLESRGFSVERELGLGGTLVAFEALNAGSIDVYPEYTGTLAQAVLGTPGLTRIELQTGLQSRGLQMPVMLGFNNSYALALREDIAKARDITTIGELSSHPDLRAAFSHEFLNRADGWGALRMHYGLNQQAVGIEHALAYDALEQGRAELTEAYTTDGELQGRALRLLRDDRSFFPEYQAVLLARSDLPVAAADVLSLLDNALDDETMRQLNYRVAVSGESAGAVAASFLRASGLSASAVYTESSAFARIARNTATHLKLTGIALLLGCLVAIPGALILSRFAGIAKSLLYLTGLIQTIPALALLALLIPLVGLGEMAAILALFLYSLLPIVRNTLAGLFSVDPLLKQVATGMGLTPMQRLRFVELPLATPTILAGVKTATIVSIGTATLAAFVGAGGLGDPIITGLNLNNHRLILEGAIPAALLAVVAELLFELIERLAIPAHLRT